MRFSSVLDDQTGDQVTRADAGNLKRAYEYGRIAYLREAQLAASMRRLLGGDVCHVDIQANFVEGEILSSK